MEPQLDEARCVIVIWSKRSVGSEGRFVRDEAARAQRRGVYVPVLIDAVEPPLGFGESQARSLRGWHGNASDPHYEAIFAAVRRIVGGDSPTSARRTQQPHLNRRTMLAGGTVAAIAVAGAGGWALLRPSPATASSESIAILPFENLSGDPNQAYFSDGIAEEIRSALARIGGLKVAGRTSSEAVRHDDAETAAKKLGVASILTGSVRQSPSTIRIAAELVDGTTGIDRWSQDYDRSPGDSIKIQTDIAENVASALSAALGTAARAAISAGGTANPQAQELVLQASEIMKLENRESAETALSLLNRAIELDPNYADAYAHKSFAVRALADIYSADDFTKGHAEALQLANTAVRLAPNFETGYRARAEVYANSLQLAPASAAYERAFRLAPGSSHLLRDFSEFLSQLGRFSESLSMADKAIAADPLDSTAYENRVGVLARAGRLPDAIAESERIKRQSPNLFNWPILLGECYLLAGRYADARASFDEGERDQPERLAGGAIAAARLHDEAAMQAFIARLKQRFGDNASYQYAEINAQLGRKEEAFAALQRAQQVRDPGLLGLKTDPFIDPLRSDPRFAPLLQSMNFPA